MHIGIGTNKYVMQTARSVLENDLPVLRWSIIFQ